MEVKLNYINIHLGKKLNIEENKFAIPFQKIGQKILLLNISIIHQVKLCKMLLIS